MNQIGTLLGAFRWYPLRRPLTRSGELNANDANPAVGTFYNPGSRIFTGKLGEYPFARNDAGYYSETRTNHDYYESIKKAIEKSGL